MKNWKKNLLKFLLSLIISVEVVFIFEIILENVSFLKYNHKYYLWPPYLSRTISLDETVFPGINGEKRFLINSYGMRGDEPSSSDVFRILALGGSTTECGVLDEVETWPARLEKLLNQNQKSNIWVGNAGRRGSTTRDHLIHMKYLLPEITNVNMLILFPGVNDLMLGLQRDYRPEKLGVDEAATSDQLYHAFYVYPTSNQSIKDTVIWKLLKHIKVSLFGRKLVAEDETAFHVEARRHRQNADSFLTSLPPLDAALDEYRHNLNTIISLAREKSLEVILLTQPSLWRKNMSEKDTDLLWFGCIHDNGYVCYSPEALADGMERYNVVVRDVCDERKVVCVDLAADLPQDTTIFYDDVHFNESGAQKVAELVYTHLVKTDLLQTTLTQPN